MTPIQNARHDAKAGTTRRVGLCLQWVRTWLGIAARYPTAADAWAQARFRHPETDPAKIPRGVAVFWTGGSHGFGHVALATGNARCYSSDIVRDGQADHVDIDLIREKWGLELAGWTEDLNGIRYYTAPRPPAPPAKKTPAATKAPAKKTTAKKAASKRS